MTPCKSWRTASGSRSLDKPQGRSYFPVDWLALEIDESQQALLAYPFVAGSVLFGEPGGPEQEGNDMAFRPLHDRVVKPQEGKVIAVGPGGRDENGKLTPLDVKAGDRVLFGKWSGTEVKIGDEELLIMKER